MCTLLPLIALGCSGAEPPPPQAVARPVLRGRAGPDTPGDMEHYELHLDLDAGSCRVAYHGEDVERVSEGPCTATGPEAGWFQVHVASEPPVDLKVARFDDLPAPSQQEMVERWLKLEPDTGLHDAAKMRARLAGGVLYDGRVYR